MEVLGKIIFVVKAICFLFIGWKYGIDGFDRYSHDFDNNLESIIGLSASTLVAVDSLFKVYGVTTFSDLFYLSFFSVLAMTVKAIITLSITFYFTKFLKNPPKAIQFVKSIFKKEKVVKK